MGSAPGFAPGRPLRRPVRIAAPRRRPARANGVVGRAARLLALLLTLALMTAGATVASSPPFAPSALALPAAITVTADHARPNFPEGVAFSLTATAPALIERVELLYAVAGQETLHLATPDFVSGRVVSVAHDLDLDDGSLPPGLDVEYRWRLEDAEGAVLETAPRTFLWKDDRFAWQTLAGERAVVHTYAGDDALGQAVLDTAQRTLARLEAAYDARLPDPVRIWVYASPDDFAGTMRANAEPWIAGASYPAYGLVLAVLPDSESTELGRVIPHEIGHIVLDAATRNPFNEPPVWLDEGLAVHAQEVSDPTFRDLVLAAAAEDRLESLRVLNSQFPYDADGALLGYAQSESIIRFILAEYGEEGLTRLIAVHRDGVTPDEAVQRALGLSLDELDARWRASLAAEAAANPPFAATDDAEGGLDPGQAVALASGSLLMGAVALLAVVTGVVSLLRARRYPLDALDAEA